MNDLIRAMVRDLTEDAVDDHLNDLLMQDLFGMQLSRGPLMEEAGSGVTITGTPGGKATYTGPHGVVVKTKSRDPQTGLYALYHDGKKIWAVDDMETAGWIAYLVALQTPEKAAALVAELKRSKSEHKAVKKVLGFKLNAEPASHKLEKGFKKAFYRKAGKE